MSFFVINLEYYMCMYCFYHISCICISILNVNIIFLNIYACHLYTSLMYIYI